jgi:PAP2 superfamily
MPSSPQIPPDPSTQYNQSTRDSYNRFLQPLTSRDARPVVTPAAAPVVAPNRPAMLQRLLENQEARQPQPDARHFLYKTSLLAEVAAGADPDFAQIIFWNEVALNFTSNDHTPAPTDLNIDSHPFEQVGPARTSRAIAIVHIAMFEAVNAILKGHQSYHGLQAKIFSISGFPASHPAENYSIRRAIAHAAYQTLKALYPEKLEYLNLIMVANVSSLQDEVHKGDAGMFIGNAAAQAILEERYLDGSQIADPIAPTDASDPLRWRRDPLNDDPAKAIGGEWARVKPFVFPTRGHLEALRPPPPPAIGSAEYNAAFTDVRNKGCDPTAGTLNPSGTSDRRPTEPETPAAGRTADELFIGKFWAYDATPLLCAPPRLYNMIATSIALKEKKNAFNNAITLARYLALVNTAMAEAAIGAWEAKFYYYYPRPVTAIRAATPATAPIHAPLPFWTPLGAPVSNGPAGRLNFTPPFPAYPSGHAVFGGAVFQVLRRFFEDDPSFEFVSDEYNGQNHDPSEATDRPLTPVTFPSLTKAEEQNARSRIYLGIHWQFDADNGVAQGRAIGNYVFDNSFQEFGP